MLFRSKKFGDGFRPWQRFLPISICRTSLKERFTDDKEADEIEKAVKAVLADGYRTVDIMSDGMKKVGCKEMGQLIIDQIK